MEGDFAGEERPRLLVAGAWSFNHKASRLSGQRGGFMPAGQTRNIGSYFVDLILKYRGWAFYTDFMGRTCPQPTFGTTDPAAFVYTGQGLNVQTSYLFNKRWEIALRNSTLFPDGEIHAWTGYRTHNQTTFGVTRYIIGHSLKVQADLSYNTYDRLGNTVGAGLRNGWELRFQVELGL